MDGRYCPRTAEVDWKCGLEVEVEEEEVRTGTGHLGTGTGHLGTGRAAGFLISSFFLPVPATAM